MNNKETSASAPAGGTDDGESRVEIERKMDEAFWSGETQKAIRMAKKAYESCKEASDELGMAIFLQKLGQYYEQDGDPEKMERCYAMALELYQELGDTYATSEIYSSLGLSERDIDKAIEMFQHQLKALNELGAHRFALSWCYECMGMRYEEEGDFRSALVAYQSILDIFEQDKSIVNFTLTWGNGRETEEIMGNEPHIAYIQQKMAQVHGHMSEYEAAFELFEKVLVVSRECGDFIRSECGTSDIYRHMGDIEMDRRNYRRALEHYTLAFEHDRDRPDFESDYESRQRVKRAKQMMNWTEIYSKKEGE